MQNLPKCTYTTCRMNYDIFNFFFFVNEDVPGICLAHPMITTSSRSAKSHSVVRALMSLSGTVGSGMAQIFSGSATNKWETILLSAGSDQSTARSLVASSFFDRPQSTLGFEQNSNRLQETQCIPPRLPYTHINQPWEHTQRDREAAVLTGAFPSSSSPRLYLPLRECSLSPGMEMFVEKRVREVRCSLGSHVKS